MPNYIPPVTTTLVCCFLSFTITMASIHLLKPLAQRLGLMDIPGGRKQHATAMPLLGGFGVFVGLTFAMLSYPTSLVGYRPFAAASILLVFVGILDDLHEISALMRLGLELLAGLIMTTIAGVVLTSLGDLFFTGNIHLGYFAIPFTMFATVGLINAVNMTDGVDGLAGSVCLTQLIWLCCLAWTKNLLLDLNVLLFLAAAIFGFLCLNFPLPGIRKTKVFMGDAGTMFLGFVLSWFAIRFSQGDYGFSPVIFLWIMGLTLWDALRVIMLRIYQRRSVFSPDRKHLHHLLEQLHCNPLQITLISSVLSFGLGAVGWIGFRNQLSDGVLFFGFLVGFAIYSLAINTYEIYVGRTKRSVPAKHGRRPY